MIGPLNVSGTYRNPALITNLNFTCSTSSSTAVAIQRLVCEQGMTYTLLSLTAMVKYNFTEPTKAFVRVKRSISASVSLYLVWLTLIANVSVKAVTTTVSPTTPVTASRTGCRSISLISSRAMVYLNLSARDTLSLFPNPANTTDRATCHRNLGSIEQNFSTIHF